jgi:hypothetical protein
MNWYHAEAQRVTEVRLLRLFQTFRELGIGYWRLENSIFNPIPQSLVPIPHSLVPTPYLRII